MKTVQFGLLGLTAGGVLAAINSSASAAVVFATNFNSATPGTYSDNTVINGGGATNDNVTVRSATGSSTVVVDRGSGNLALQLTDNSSDNATLPRAYSNTFGPLSTTATGENRLFGSFDYTRLLTNTTTATSPTFQLVIASGGATSSGGGTSAVQLTVEPNGSLAYLNGGTATNSGFTLVTGTEYTFAIDLDLSNATQDTWSLVVTPAGSATPVLTRTGINTRAANVAVNIISFNGGVNTTALNTSAFNQIDNINFQSSPIPEPSSALLVAAAGGLMIRRRRAY